MSRVRSLRGSLYRFYACLSWGIVHWLISWKMLDDSTLAAFQQHVGIAVAASVPFSIIFTHSVGMVSAIHPLVIRLERQWMRKQSKAVQKLADDLNVNLDLIEGTSDENVVPAWVLWILEKRSWLWTFAYGSIFLATVIGVELIVIVTTGAYDHPAFASGLAMVALFLLVASLTFSVVTLMPLLDLEYKIRILTTRRNKLSLILEEQKKIYNSHTSVLPWPRLAYA